MPGLRMTIEMDPDAIKLNRVFSRLGDITDLTEPFHDIIEDFKTTEARRFASSGPGWARLSPRYAAWKAVHYPGQPILVRRGAMRAEATGGFESHVSKMEMRIVLRDPKVRFHQRGTSRMPQRKVVDIGNADKNRWGKLVQKYAMKVVDRAFSAA